MHLLPLVLSVFAHFASASPPRVILEPDEDGNLYDTNTDLPDFSIAEDSILEFQNLGPNDKIIEIDNPINLTGTHLCNTASIGIAAHAVPLPDPAAVGLHDANELSSYPTFPAGIFAMNQGTDACRPFESSIKAACTAGVLEVYDENGPNEAYLCRGLPGAGCNAGLVMDETWDIPGVQGAFIRLDWKDIETTDDGFNWLSLDRSLVSAMRRGKDVTIGIRVGGNSIPGWLFNQAGADRLDLKDWGSGDPPDTCGTDYVMASPADQVFNDQFLALLGAMGTHIREDQRRFSTVAGIKISGLGQATIENRLPKRCNIADHFTETPPAGKLVDVTALNWTEDPDFIDTVIDDISTCVCNPDVLLNGTSSPYSPTALYSFYDEVQAQLQTNFGFKQKVFMSVADGWPEIGDPDEVTGVARFLGDHLLNPLLGVAPVDNTFPHDSGYPAGNSVTKQLLANGKIGAFAGGVPEAEAVEGEGFAVENASLDPIHTVTGEFGICPHMMDIETNANSRHVGSPVFPNTTAPNDLVEGDTCPNLLVTKAGIVENQVTGFQVSNHSVLTAADIDQALWNMSANTNGLFIELYEADLWYASHEMDLELDVLSEVNPYEDQDNPLSPVDPAFVNWESAEPKSLTEWNQELFDRATTYSIGALPSVFRRHPHPTGYEVVIAPGQGGTTRYFFNARACIAYNSAAATPVVINAMEILP